MFKLIPVIRHTQNVLHDFVSPYNERAPPLHPSSRLITLSGGGLKQIKSSSKVWRLSMQYKIALHAKWRYQFATWTIEIINKTSSLLFWIGKEDKKSVSKRKTFEHFYFLIQFFYLRSFKSDVPSDNDFGLAWVGKCCPHMHLAWWNGFPRSS